MAVKIENYQIRFPLEAKVETRMKTRMASSRALSIDRRCEFVIIDAIKIIAEVPKSAIISSIMRSMEPYQVYYMNETVYVIVPCEIMFFNITIEMM